MAWFQVNLVYGILIILNIHLCEKFTNSVRKLFRDRSRWSWVLQIIWPCEGTFLWRVFLLEFVGSMIVQRSFWRRCCRMPIGDGPVWLRLRRALWWQCSGCRRQGDRETWWQDAVWLCHGRLQAPGRCWSGFCGCWDVYECAGLSVAQWHAQGRLWDGCDAAVIM